MELTEFLQNHLQKAALHAPKTYFPFSAVEGGLPKGSLIEISGTVGGGKLEALLRFLRENPSLQVAWLEEGMTTYPCAFPQHGVELNRVLFVHADSSKEGSQLLPNAHLVLRSQIFEVLVLIPSLEKVPHTTTTQSQAHASHQISSREDGVAPWSDARRNEHAMHPQRRMLSARSSENVRSKAPTGANPDSQQKPGVKCEPNPRDSRFIEARGFKGAQQTRESDFGEIELRRLQLAAEKSGTTIFIVRETPSVAQTWPLSVQLQVKRATPSLGGFRGELSVKILKYRSQPLVEISSSQALA